MAIREGKWRCPYCASVNRGAHLSCQGCGATRDKDVRFFLEDDAPEVTDEALLSQARSGPDWLCQFCQTSNKAAEPRCGNCGAERGASPARPEQDVARASGLLSASTPGPPKPRPGRRRGCGIVAAVVLLLGLGFCSVFSYFALRKTEERVTVAGFRWERSVDVEAWRKVQETAWEGEQPSGARVVGRSREVHHTEREETGTERVKVGTRDKGNGFFEDVYEERPVYSDRDVYRTKLRYEIEKWVVDRTAKAEGNDQSPRWPDTRLRSGEREARRSERYTVVVQGRRTYRIELPFERWSSLRLGETRMGVVRGGVRLIELR
jgi:hypothetical protein